MVTVDEVIAEYLTFDDETPDDVWANWANKKLALTEEEQDSVDKVVQADIDTQLEDLSQETKAIILAQ